jgi:large subunit ribosomal protein L25
VEKIELSAELRDEVGSIKSRRMRSTGFIPGVLYGKGEEPVSLKVSLVNLHRIISKGENILINLKVDNKEKTVMIKEIQHDPIEDSIVHVDFYKISLQEKITVQIPIEIIGEAKGVKEKGGVLEQILRELEVRCLPTNIPEKIALDVSSLDIGHSYAVDKLIIPEGVEVLTLIDSPVATVIAPTTLEDEKKLAGEMTEPELITKKKEEGEGEAGAADEEKGEVKKEEGKKSSKQEKDDKK